MAEKTEITRKSERELVITRTFDAPRELVWKAWTDPARIPHWWGPRRYETIVDVMDVRPGGRWRFRNRDAEGHEFAFHGEYREVVPPERIVQTFEFEGMPGHVSIDTATLEDIGGGRTKVTARSLFASVEDLQAMVASGMEEGARETYDRLGELLQMMKAGSRTANPSTGGALVLSRTFDATTEQLWAAWTDPAIYAKWFNPAGIDLVIHEFEVRPGGRVRFDMLQPDGNPNPQEGVFHSLDPYREIVSGSPDKSFLIRVLFEPVGKGTRMTVEVTGMPPEVRATATKGWNAGFDHLAKILAAEPASPPNGFTIERTFRAPPEKLWEMWTTKAGLEKWFTGPGWKSQVTHVDARVGGGYSITMTDGKQTIRNHGTYTEVTRNRRLAYTWHFDIFLGPGDKPYDVPITVDFQAVPGGTKMTFTQGALATAANTEGSRQGVLANFENLARALEG